MPSRRMLNQILSVAVLGCQTLGVVELANCQIAHKPAQSEQTAGPYAPHIISYNNFILAVGKEDDRIHREELAGKTQTVDRTYYPAGIPLKADEEQMMFSTILEASRKEKEADARLGCHLGERRMELASRYGDAQAAQMVQSDEEACLKEELPIAQDAILELKNELGAQSFRWLTDWVGSSRWIRITETRDPNPCPPNYNPPTGMTTHLACGLFYELFFDDFANVETWNRQKAAEGKTEEQEHFNTRIHLPEDKRQAVIALGLEASHEIKESDEQFITQSQDFIAQNNLKLDAKTRRYPFPPEIEALEMRSGVLLEEYIFKLKQTLGDSLFKRFDTELSMQNLGIMKPHASPVRPSAPAAQQISDER